MDKTTWQLILELKMNLAKLRELQDDLRLEIEQNRLLQQNLRTTLRSNTPRGQLLLFKRKENGNGNG